MPPARKNQYAPLAGLAREKNQYAPLAGLAREKKISTRSWPAPGAKENQYAPLAGRARERKSVRASWPARRPARRHVLIHFSRRAPNFSTY